MAIMRTANGTREVFTIVQDGNYSSRLYVNVNHAKGDIGDATLICAKHSTEAGARRWVAKQLTT